MAYFECVVGGGGTSLTIQITTSSTVLYGQTITISKGGSTVGTTAFDNTGNAEYTVRETGTYTVSVTYSGTTFSNTVEVTNTFDTEIYATPDGSTVTPVNDIQIWLHCGNVWDKNYTTLSEVLADTTTLLTLINSNNAVDYMVRSHDWCDDVCADATAMTYIGANNYAADTLLADDNPGLVPVMTSDTTPSGECLYSDEYYSRYAYYAFDNNWNKTINYTAAITAFNGWASGSDRNVYLGYDFGQAVLISQVAFRNGGYASSPYLIDTYKIQYSDDNSVWTDATNELTAAKTYDKQVVTLPSASSHRYWRLFVVFNGTATYATLVSNLQFYAKDGSWLESICNSTYFESVLNVKVPTMTSDTTPSGQCYSNPACSSSYPAYRVFDGNDSTEGSMGTAYKTAMGYYRFTAPVKVQKFDCLTIYETTKLTVKYSDDGTNWNDAAEYSVLNVSSKLTFAINVAMNAHPYWGVERQASTGRGSSFYTIQFYGRSAS